MCKVGMQIGTGTAITAGGQALLLLHTHLECRLHAAVLSFKTGSAPEICCLYDLTIMQAFMMHHLSMYAHFTIVYWQLNVIMLAKKWIAL